MSKKYMSLLIILATLSSLSFVLFANDFVSGFFTQADKKTVLEYAHGLDRSGNTYFIRKEKDQAYLVSLDSTGRQSFKKNITENVIKRGIFDSIFIDQDKNLFLTVYGMQPNSTQVSKIGIYRFREDGSFVSQIFDRGLQQNYDNKYRLISAMSDDDKSVFFGLINGKSLDVFSYDKNNSAPAKKVNSYVMGESADKINASYVLPSGDALFGLEGGTLLKKSNSENKDTIYNFGNRVIIERFWFAGNQFYFQDAVSGNMYISSSSKIEPSLVVRGTKIVSEKDMLSFSKLNPVAVGNVGNVAGVYDSEYSNRIFVGGFAFLPEIGSTNMAAGKDLTRWLMLIGIVAGILILSFLIWDFYCSILHMRLSMLLRQAFLVILVIILSLYYLTSLIIIPNSKQITGNVHLTEQLKVGQMFIATSKGFITGQGSSELDGVKVAAFFKQFIDNGQISPINNELSSKSVGSIQNMNETKLSLLSKNQGQYTITATNEGFETGFPAARMGYGPNFEKGLKEAEIKSINTFEVLTAKGKKLCVLLPTGMTSSGSPVLLSMIVDLDALDNMIADMSKDIAVYMAMIGVLLMVLVIAIEYISVHNIRRLRNSVDRIAEGNYASEIAVTSGDEVEDLADSVRALAKNILSKTNSLNKLNQSYYRFVPQRFLEIIGETHIENVGKKSQAQKENVIMLFLRFRFEFSLGEQNREIFTNINDVFENLVPVVSENKGTVYDFLPEGFNAIFESRPEEVLRTALRIREVLAALNEKRKESGQGKVDVRIFLAKGNIMLGLIGEEKRMEPTAISSETQKAEPIVRVCFDSDIYISCTKEIYKALPAGGYRSRRIGEVVIREEKVELFDIFDSDPYALLKAKEVNSQRFDLGVNLFIKKDYTNARNVFMDIIKYSSLDGAARNYMYLAEHNLRSEQKLSTYTTISEIEKMR